MYFSIESFLEDKLYRPKDDETHQHGCHTVRLHSEPLIPLGYLRSWVFLQNLIIFEQNSCCLQKSIPQSYKKMLASVCYVSLLHRIKEAHARSTRS